MVSNRSGATILVADDDGHIREVVRYALARAGFDVLEAEDGAEALRIARSVHVDLVVLDIIMPRESGIDVMRSLSSVRIPVILLTSRDEEVDRVMGLELGADDYVTKPFSPRELVARVRAVLRRTAEGPRQEPGKIVSCADLSLDFEQHRCLAGGVEVDLTVTEFAILGTLMRSPGKVFTRSELVARSYGDGRHVTDRTMDSHVRRIRQKIVAAGANDPVETVHGLGYRFSVPEGG